MTTEYKRKDPKPVTSVTVVEPRVRFAVYNTDGSLSRKLTGQGVAFPGFEGYRIVVVPPHGNVRAANKVRWSVWEETTGMQIAREANRESSFETVCATALRRLEGFGKKIVDAAIESHTAKRLELQERTKRLHPFSK